MTITVVTRSIKAGTPANGGGISVPGHAWLELHHSNGTVESYGYYPATPNWTSDGVTRTDDAAKYKEKGYASDPILITSQQADAFRTWAQNTDASGNWTLPGSSSTGAAWNCATWTYAAFDFANVDGRFAAQTFLPWFVPFSWPTGDVGQGYDALGNRSGPANLNSVISGNSGPKAQPMMAGTGVFDGQEISASYPAHPHQRVQSACRACRIAGRQDDGATVRTV